MNLNESGKTGNRNHTLVLVTTTYPTGGVTESTFIAPEIEALAKEFKQVIVVPTVDAGNEITLNLPNVIMDLSVARHPFSRFKLLKHPLLAAPSVIRNYPRIAGAQGFRQFFRQCCYCMNIKAFGLMFENIVERHRLEPESTLLYTFWFDYQAMALTLSSRFRKFNVISRAHGYDVFETPESPRPHHLRVQAVAKLKRLFPAAHNSTSYLKALYGSSTAHIETRALGSTKLFEGEARTSPEGTLTFLSVARVVPVKHVERNLELVTAIAKANPSVSIRWIHVGDGSCMQSLQQNISALEHPANLLIDLRGELTNRQVQQIYITEPIDWFMLLSDSEGGMPICICEALSYGVPVIATNVGGIPEIVTPDVGITAAAASLPQAATEWISQQLDNPDSYQLLKRNALHRWQQNFAANTLRARFAQEISQLTE